MIIPERRARHRFAMRHRVEFTSAGKTLYVEGVTRNVSVSGVLFESASAHPGSLPRRSRPDGRKRVGDSSNRVCAKG